MCGSGLKAVMLADQAIRTNSAGVVVAGGIESMSNAPYLILKNLNRFGHKRMIDSMIHDGLYASVIHIQIIFFIRSFHHDLLAYWFTLNAVHPNHQFK